MKACVCDDYPDAPTGFQAVVTRCEHASKLIPTLDSVAHDTTTWVSVERCRVCGAFWAREHPFSEHHGGGPPCLYRIATNDPEAWLRQHSGFTSRLRDEHEQAAFLASLGSESGPELCRHPGCTHLHIRHSVFCCVHHVASLNALGH